MMDARTPRLLAAAAAGAACALAAACEGGDSGTAASDFATVGGVVRVANSGAAPEWRLEPVVSIGPESVTAREAPNEFGRVSAVALGPDGTIFVADAANHEVRAFGLDGEHIRTFGREGEGPGEFRSIYSIAWLGDRLLAFDPLQGRIGEFTAEGEWLGQRRTAGGVTGSSTFIRFFPVGPDEAFRFALSPDMGSLWVGLDSRGETGDTVPWLRVPEGLPGASETIVCRSGGAIGFYPHAVGAQFLQHPASGGLMYSAWGYDYRVAATRGDGDTLRVIERTLPTEPVSDEAWAAGSAEFEEARGRFPTAACNPRGYTRPERSAFIEDLFVSPDGELWVEVIRAAGNRWEIFDAEGRLLGYVPTPPYGDRTVPVFRGEHVATIRQDALDQDHVDVWRLERTSR